MKDYLPSLKKDLNHYIFSFLYLPFCFYKIKTFKSKNKLLNFVFHDIGYLAPMQVKSEIVSLLNFVKDIKAKTIMEIGTARGGTLFLFSKILLEDSFIISLDLPGGSFGGGYSWYKILLYKSFAREKTSY